MVSLIEPHDAGSRTEASKTAQKEQEDSLSPEGTADEEDDE